eukprot:c20250_g2_i2.p1 GENE.c20250_g2_i2~~c20250_g2_i2.p1  ORF type:complete len:163 (+),score=65.94 c20250_g2_i2:19-507(+)
MSSAEVDLVSFIDFTKCECLNAATGSWENCLKQGLRSTETAVSSECDEQLILTVGFQQRVKLSKVQIRGPVGTAPKVVKIFLNTSGFSFDDTDSRAPTQVLTLSEPNTIIQLDHLKFQDVSNLSLFIENNQNGGELTQINEIVLHGVPYSTTNVSELKKVAE